jgi:hypothetical protein
MRSHFIKHRNPIERLPLRGTRSQWLLDSTQAIVQTPGTPFGCGTLTEISVAEVAHALPVLPSTG